jgi:acetolactate synthase-1/2/3 large subunit
MEMTGGEALAAQLAAEGVKTVFGVPGVQLDHAFDGLWGQRERIHFIGTRHEQATTYMADGFARTRDEVGVALVVPGPGVLNASAGLATAYACSSPVVLLAGQIASGRIGQGYGLLHEIPDQSGILARLTKWTAMARRPDEIPGLVREAFRQARGGRPRPVALELPPDVLAARAAVNIITPPRGERDTLRPRPEPAEVRRAADLLRRAARPLIWAGGGILASDATAELGRLADLLQAPVVMSENGRGALSDRHPLALNSVAGRRLLPDADVVLAVGTRFVGIQGQSFGAGKALIVLNADPHDAAFHPDAAVRLTADAKLGLAALADELASLPKRSAPPYDLAAVRAEAEAQMAEVTPQAAYVRVLREAIPEDGILVNELTQVGYLARIAYPVYQPRTLINPGYQGTLGYGFPTALGVKVGSPDRVVVSITGDGGFGWGLQELATARRYNLGLVTVVFNDAAFGNVKRTQQEEFGGHVIGTDLVNPDFVRLAEAFGIAGFRVDSPESLAPVLREAVTAGEPCLIEVQVGKMTSPWPLLIGRSASDRR